ncbi:MAG: UbiX family flavin prenyltransferase [Desulfovibrio sp.]|nr:UbiX family flavin prenyltransferase [Desulfovibrio sp.]
MPNIVVGVSGASGMPLVRDMLAFMASIPRMRIHLIISRGAHCVMRQEGGIIFDELTSHAVHVYEPEDMAAGPSSGSWRHDGMVICPCSMSTLASIACGAGMNLIHRAADVSLKERRPLILVARETPLNLIHLKNMQFVTEAGAVVMPFCPAYYTGRASLRNMVRHFTGRVLDQLGICHSLCCRWQEDQQSGKAGGDEKKQ